MKDFGELFEKARRMLVINAFKLTKDLDGADDLVQETALSGLRAFAQYDPDKPFSDWIYRILVNEHLQEVRRQERRVPEVRIDAEVKRMADERPPSRNPRSLSEEAIMLMILVDGLDEPFRRTLLMDIAGLEEPGLHPATKRSRILRARKRLFEHINI